MHSQRRLASILTVALLLVSITAMRVAAPAACTLLTTADASTALEKPSQPGKEFAGPTSCQWSNDPAASDSSVRVTLNTHSVRSFQIAMHPAITTITIEPVSGIGDEAFYQIYPNGQTPFIWVRKGDNTFDVRIITRLKPKPPFTNDQLKSKIAVLAKAAVGKL